MHKSLSLGLIALLLSACATPYQARSKTMGYYETETAPGHYRIYFNAERHTDWATINSYLERRAQDISQATGGKGYTVLKREQEIVEAYHSQNSHAHAVTNAPSLTSAKNGTTHVNGTIDIYQLPFSYRQGRLDIALQP